MKKIWDIFKAVWAILTKPHFKTMLSNLDYLQIYNDKHDLIIILGRNPSSPSADPNPDNIIEQWLEGKITSEQLELATKRGNQSIIDPNMNTNLQNNPNTPNPAMNCVLALKEIVKEGILDMSEDRYVLTFVIDAKGKQEVQKVLGK